MRYRMLICLTMLIFGLGVVAGCGKSDKVKTVDVSGTVYLDGDPLAGVSVFFLTEEHTGTATTGPDGTYRLENGAPPGENKVYFSKIEGGGLQDAVDDGGLATTPIADDAAEAAAPETSEQLIPKKYTDPLNPQKTFPVPEGGTTSADFRLTSE